MSLARAMVWRMPALFAAITGTTVVASWYWGWTITEAIYHVRNRSDQREDIF